MQNLPEPACLAIDVGTTSTRAIVYRFRRNGSAVSIAQASEPLSLRRFGDGNKCVEQEGHEILSATRSVIRRALADASQRDAYPTKAGLTVQRSSVLLWCPSSCSPLSPVLSWQDRRVDDWLRRQPWDDQELKFVTGLPRSPHYGAGKLRWLSKTVPSKQPFVAGPLASFLLQNLTIDKTLATDPTQAARMQLLDLVSPYEWCEKWLSRFEIDADWLPPILPSISNFGCLDTAPEFSMPIPLVASCGDQYAAFYAQGRRDNELMTNLGTGGFLMSCISPVNGQSSSPEISDRLERTPLLRSPGPLSGFLLEGTINGVGAALVWAAKRYELNVEKLKPALRSAKLDDAHRPLFLNYVGGLGSPWWIAGGDSRWVNERGAEQEPTSYQEALLSVLESIAFLVHANVEAMRSAGVEFDSIRISGGVSLNDSLCQLIADLSECLVLRSDTPEATARGIAWLATSHTNQKPARLGQSPEQINTFHPQRNPKKKHRSTSYQSLIH